MSLNQIADEIKACMMCPLREGATQPVPGYGNPQAKYVLIGEAPGRDEDKAGMPFVGLAGKRLNTLLALGNISQNDCYFTNVCRCRPPDNRTPRKNEVRACSPYLYQELEEIQPEYIVTLGATPLKLFTETGVSQLHGTMFEVEI